ncbi:MAG: ATP-binding protein [Planctomycetes bacterium]|nr:ATP-binding protein [Planctomycetota bacterium]
MFHRILTLVVTREIDVRRTRKALRRLAALAGLPPDREKELGAAVSEIARNACLHAGGGTVDVEIDQARRDQAIRVRVEDHGPGIPGVNGSYHGDGLRSVRLGPGLERARSLVDELTIHSERGRGTRVVLRKTLPAHVPKATAQTTSRWTIELTRRVASHALARTHRRTLAVRQGLDIRRRREEALRRARDSAEAESRARNALLGRFLHEIRGPLDTIIDLSERALETDAERERRDALRIVGETARALREFLETTGHRLLAAAGTDPATAAADRLAAPFETPPAAAEPPAAGPAVVDLDAALNRLEGNEQLLADLVRFFLDDHERLLARIESALARRRFDELLRATHRLKGLLSNLDAPLAVRATARLEALCREDDLPGAQGALPGLREELGRVRHELRRSFGSEPSAPAASAPPGDSGS